MAALQTRSLVIFSEWSTIAAPGAGLLATASIVAPGNGFARVCSAYSVSMTADGAAQPTVQWVIRDGSSFSGPIIWTGRMAGDIRGTFISEMTELCLLGSNNNQMTVEFLVAPAAGNFQAVSMSGYIVRL